MIHAPLDLRLKAPEVLRCLGLIQAKAYAFLGKTPIADFGELGKAVQANCPFVQHLIQFAGPGEDAIDGALPALALVGEAQALATAAQASGPGAGLLAEYFEATSQVGEEDGAQVIFTTGSTRYPKPALQSHQNITCQNMCLGAAL
jgi:fatty-acyl-CoA synthase